MRTVRVQNVLLLLVSYLVYLWWDVRMWWLLVVATLFTYVVGWGIARLLQQHKERAASLLITFGVSMEVGLLIVFKYLDFFAGEAVELCRTLGFNLSWTALHLVLPVGLSFYTFKLISYLVEIHREHIPAERDLITFAAYVAFFPTILAGPIDRPQTFLPQLHQARKFSWANLLDGSRMMLWGLCMKVCLADQVAPLTDQVWVDGGAGTHLHFWAFLMYPMQMYADFSGYSLMAIGAGRMIGFVVTPNFKQPFLARNVAEYWRRWHMSLTQWITDYVFMPLNLRWRNLGKLGLAAAVTVNLVVIGLWHGANWTYLLFGLYHALLFMPLIFISGTFGKRKKLRAGRMGLPSASDFGKMLLTYLLVAIAFVLFRAPDVTSVVIFFSNLFCLSIPSLPAVGGSRWFYLLFIFGMLVLEYVQRDVLSPLHFKGNGLLKFRFARWTVYYFLLLLLYVFSEGAASQFIYTQF